MNAVAKIKPDAEVEIDPLAKMRAPFPDNQVSKLPKETKAQREEREKDRAKGVKCNVCAGWHHKSAVHLDYVGHAALTDRLLDVDPMWFWEPLALRDGLPAFDATGGLWIKLTICGMTRLGYGHAAGKPNMDPGAREKEVIGDALRNAAMRFGAALDLWHKGDLHAPESETDEPRQTAADMAINLLRGCSTDSSLFKEAWEKNKDGWKAVLDAADAKRVWAVKDELVAKFKADAEAATPAPVTLADGTPFDDEIPF